MVKRWSGAVAPVFLNDQRGVIHQMSYRYPKKTGKNTSWIPPDQWKRRLWSIPVPNHLKIQIAKDFVSWSEHSGEEWAVDRFKQLKDCLMQSWAAGKKLTAKPEWFATTRRGRLAGTYGAFWSYAMNSSRTFKAALFVCNIHTAVSRKDTTELIDLEIGNNIQSTPVFCKWGDPGTKVLRKALAMVHRRRWFNAVKCGKPVPLSMVPPGKESHILKVPQHINELWMNPIGRIRGPIRDALGGMLACESFEDQFDLDFMKVGEVHVTHEPGMKTRYFAAPNLVLQRALEPLKQGLFKVLADVPWDCTLSQRSADPHIRNALKRGRRVHSIDMSKATDNFPWFFQRELLMAMTDRRDCETRESVRLMVEMVENGQWELPESMDYVRWTKGQPLGLGPSFPLFTLSHGLLLYALNNGRWDNAFYVLGDDVIILEDTLALKYRKMLETWGVDVSELKSFSSENLAQFAGVTYTRDDSFFVPKWRQYTRDTLLDVAAWWYPGLTRGMRDEVLIDYILALPQPYGMGRNPRGIPLDDRFPQWVADRLVEREEARKREAKPSTLRNRLSDYFDLLLTKNDQAAINTMRKYVQWYSDDYYTGYVSRTRDSKERIPARSYAPGTEIPGGLVLRYNPQRNKRDPYTLGTLASWRRLVHTDVPSSDEDGREA